MSGRTGPPRLWPVLMVIVLLGVVIAWSIQISWAHPDMTDRRLLRTFWRSYLVMAVVMIAGGMLVAWVDKRDAAAQRRRKAMRARGQGDSK